VGASGCVLSARGPAWEDLLAEQAQKEVAASAYAHGSATLADDTNVEEKQVLLTILPTLRRRYCLFIAFPCVTGQRSRNSTGRRSPRKRSGPH
jgi:hypothetical protein